MHAKFSSFNLYHLPNVASQERRAHALERSHRRKLTRPAPVTLRLCLACPTRLELLQQLLKWTLDSEQAKLARKMVKTKHPGREDGEGGQFPRALHVPIQCRLDLRIPEDGGFESAKSLKNMKSSTNR